MTVSFSQLNEFCGDCKLGKACQLPYSYTNTRYTAPLRMVCVDVWGPSPFPSTPLSLKSQVQYMFIAFHKLVERQFSTKLQCLQSDMVKSLFLSHLILLPMVLLIENRVPIPLSRMALLRESIKTLWKWVYPF